VDIISNGAPSRALNIGVDCRVSSVWVGGGLGVNRGQSDASSSYWKIKYIYETKFLKRVLWNRKVSFVSFRYNCGTLCSTIASF